MMVPLQVNWTVYYIIIRNSILKITSGRQNIFTFSKTFRYGI